MSGIELFSPGSLGTCWYGKYHYMEPWAGCAHSCPYCYARSRGVVNESLNSLSTTFPNPKLLMPADELLRTIADTVNSGSINILKLCRYTDMLTPGFVANGFSHEIFKILFKSKVSRIILTTKGKPDEDMIKLFCDNSKKLSYNAAFRPSSIDPVSSLKNFDAYLYPVQERLDAASLLAMKGVQTTIHMDPFVATVDDYEGVLIPFLDMLKARGLNRVMWSYLLLSPGIMGSMQKAIKKDVLDDLCARYDFDGARKILPGQDDTLSFAQRNEVALKSVDKVATTLHRMGFDFVLCSLKSVKGLDLKKYPKTMLCDGKFYA